MILIDILLYISKKKMFDYSDADHYCSAYEKILNKIIKMIGNDSDITAKSIKILIQGFMIANSREVYASLVA